MTTPVKTAGQRPEPGNGRRPCLRARVQVAESAGSLRYDVQVGGAPRAGPGPVPGELSFFLEVSGEVVPAPVARYDFVVLALILLAMRRGVDLHVEAPVSRDLLVNLEEFQRAWVAWVPWRYGRVRVSCDREVEPEFMDGALPGRRSAVLAFSGGVDSLCAMLDLLEFRDARDGCDLKAAVLIHGFDVGVDEHPQFAAARRDAGHATGAAGVPMSVVRTNLRDVLAGEWPHEFGAAVAACLSLFTPVARLGVLASDVPYSYLLVPWGSNPITNPLMSSDAFRILTWGGSINRTARAAVIARHTPIGDRIRVCWEGPRHGENCGVCEKCVRTKLNFLAAGAPVPPSLGEAPGFWQVLGMVANERAKLDLLVDIAEASRGVAFPPGLRAALRLTILKNRVLLPFRRWRRMVRGVGRRLAGRPPRRV